MALTSLWLSSQAELSDKHIQALVGFAGDGKLRDGSATAAEFREFLNIISAEHLARFAMECLSEERFSEGPRALQDIINEVGRRLGFQSENGLYQGRSGQVGFDGLWRGDDGSAILVEVKTTDTYSIDLDTIANYRRVLIENGKIGADGSSILIVVGRADTGSWEAQVRGSRHAWDIRLISVQALLRLMKIKHDLDDPKVIERIRAVLKPREFTKVDEIVDLVFSAAEDVKKEVEPIESEDEEDDTEGEEVVKRKPKFTPVNFRDACAERLGAVWEVPLIKRSFAHYSTADETRGVFCLNSRLHMRGTKKSYWFALHPHQVEALRKHKDGYVALGCGSVDYLIVVPLAELETWTAKLWTTTREDRAYWHLVVLENNGPKLVLSKPNRAVDLTPYILRAG